MTTRYVVKEQLASGGMGVVYRVHDRQTGEARALKRIQPDVAAEPFHIAAFEREYQVLAGLDHPRIIRVFDYDVDEIGPFYTMELLEGDDLKTAAPLPFRTACLYLRDVATSLSLLHARRLIHRDLSPSNVRMTPDGHCKLLDFGVLAAFGSSRVVVGTPPAIPPEALQGAPLDQRADLYALGALAYWILTERHAYPAKQVEDLKALWKEPPPPPSAVVDGVPKELDALVLSLLSANPLARPASAAEVIARLNVVGGLAHEGGGENERLAESFLLSPRFIGRAAHLEMVKERTEALVRGEGGALLVEASAGTGRSRLLEEICVRAQIAGACVVRVDASMSRGSRAAARALAVR
ncbi:MAG TPA: serine/threonine-protein kinase, partial [Polyangia bacterium]|nr:serine/threonine-protein kinase [Polyangia bacterium]